MNNYPEISCDSPRGIEVIPPTIKEKLEKKKDYLEMRLADVNKALALLKANPAFESLHDALTKTRVD